VSSLDDTGPVALLVPPPQSSPRRARDFGLRVLRLGPLLIDRWRVLGFEGGIVIGRSAVFRGEFLKGHVIFVSLLWKLSSYHEYMALEKYFSMIHMMYFLIKFAIT